MGQFDSYLRCTLGGTNFQLQDYSGGATPIVKEGVGRIGLEKRITGEGWIEATTAADFASRLLDAQDKFTVSGEDFRIYGLGDQVTFAITAAECVDGGPHAGFELLGQLDESQCYQKIRFTVSGKTANSGSGDGGASLYKERVDLPASGLRRLTRSGEINEPGAVAAFETSILPGFRAANPLPNYIVTHSYEYDQDQRKLKYTLISETAAKPLPASSGVNVTDGRAVRRFSRDEQGRVTVIYDFDLVLDSINYGPIWDLIRAQVTAKPELIIRESVDFESIRERRLRATFEILYGDGSDLLNWKQSFELSDGADTWRIVTHPGTDPILVKNAPSPRLLVQQGSATGVLAWPKAPKPLFPEAMVSEPRVSYEFGNNLERVTSWNYVMAAPDLSPLDVQAIELSPLNRPSQPAFVT